MGTVLNVRGHRDVRQSPGREWSPPLGALTLAKRKCNPGDVLGLSTLGTWGTPKGSLLSS